MDTRWLTLAEAAHLSLAEAVEEIRRLCQEGKEVRAANVAFGDTDFLSPDWKKHALTAHLILECLDIFRTGADRAGAAEAHQYLVRMSAMLIAARAFSVMAAALKACEGIEPPEMLARKKEFYDLQKFWDETRLVNAENCEEDAGLIARLTRLAEECRALAVTIGPGAEPGAAADQAR